ncbi:MAG: hypothetical protein ACFB11_19600 [Paracoccaceae bacterium]
MRPVNVVCTGSGQAAAIGLRVSVVAMAASASAVDQCDEWAIWRAGNWNFA